jgi:hypothetical protein
MNHYVVATCDPICPWDNLLVQEWIIQCMPSKLSDDLLSSNWLWTTAPDKIPDEINSTCDLKAVYCYSGFCFFVLICFGLAWVLTPFPILNLTTAFECHKFKTVWKFLVQAAASVCFKDFQITECLTIITKNLVHSWWVYKCFKDETFG